MSQIEAAFQAGHTRQAPLTLWLNLENYKTSTKIPSKLRNVAIISPRKIVTFRRVFEFTIYMPAVKVQIKGALV